MKEIRPADFISVDISEHDVIEAMKHIQGYIDITPGDFKVVYQSACSFAINRLLGSLTAEKIMTRAVVFVDQEMPLVEAAELLAGKQISGCPVVDHQGRVVGVVSEKDFLKEMGFGVTPSFMQLVLHCLNSKNCMIHRLHNKTVGAIMTKPPITADAKMTIGAISTLFAQHQINRLPIVDNEGKPVGLVTRSDLAHSYHSLGEGSQV
ncbi:MAG: CBS domain-containing protein [Desulforhopalus sp.]|nr:CBS domain-containing protein [Desulforhopalus sp.]